MKNKIALKESLGIAIPVSVDRDCLLNYETHSFVMRVFRSFVMVPLMEFLVYFKRVGSFSFGLSSRCRKIRRYATNYAALELIYSFRVWFQSVKGIDHVFSWIWLNMSNGKAVRNRLKLVKKELKNAMLSLDKYPNIISIGSGSARAIIEATAEEGMNCHPKVILIDRSRSALSFSRELAEKCGIAQNMKWVRDYAQNLEKYCSSTRPDIIEVVGLLDYFDKEGAIDLVNKIYKVLAPGGILITCNIRDNPERRFVTHIINWTMIYRSPEELTEIVTQGGFDPIHCRIVYEPLKLHGLVICKKLV